MDNKKYSGDILSNFEKAMMLMEENELRSIRRENISFDDMSVFQRAVLLSQDEELDRLGITKEYLKSEKGILFMRNYLGMDVSEEQNC